MQTFISSPDYVAVLDSRRNGWQGRQAHLESLTPDDHAARKANIERRKALTCPACHAPTDEVGCLCVRCDHIIQEITPTYDDTST